MKEQIRNLENEILVLMTAKNDRGQKVYDVDLQYKRAVFAKQCELQKLVDADRATVRVSAEDQANNAAFAAYQERQHAARALLNDNQMPLEHTLKARALEQKHHNEVLALKAQRDEDTAKKAAKDSSKAVVQAAPAAAPVGRGGAIFSKTG